MTSNSSAEIGDKKTATLLAEASRGSAARLAAVALHEGFHVFQRTRHPAWVANEGELFLYPFSDPDQLAWRRMETEMLRRAVAATEDDTAACWSGAAMSARSQRYAALDERFRAYEIGNEWNEGLAQYVQHRAIGDSPLEFPEAGFEATALRTRFYTVGPALGLLLDRLRPQWRTDLEEDDARPVHELFEEAVEGSATCTLSAEEIGAFTERAHRDAAAIGQDRQNRRVRFDADPGPRLVIVAAPDEPFWPQGFDPLNVEVIDGGLLHSRMLELGNDRGSVTAIDGDNADLTVLTIAAGDHPLFNGVRRVEILGVSDLEQSETEGRVHLSGPGLEVDLGPAEVETTGSTTRVRVAVPSVDS